MSQTTGHANISSNENNNNENLLVAGYPSYIWFNKFVKNRLYMYFLINALTWFANPVTVRNVHFDMCSLAARVVQLQLPKKASRCPRRFPGALVGIQGPRCPGRYPGAQVYTVKVPR